MAMNITNSVHCYISGRHPLSD